MKEEYIAKAPAVSFISANSADGFFSLYDEVFDTARLDRIFILAGGPGTGKSTLLRRVAALAREQRIACETVLCSSDPHSLDGVILSSGTRHVGILDGTPPHGRIPSMPAVTEELINLGEFWDAERIALSGAEIRALTERKRTQYACAYAHLRALGALTEAERILLAPTFSAQKAERQIRHKLAPLRLLGAQTRRLLRAFSGKGEWVLPFSRDSVGSLLLISGRNAAAEIYLSLFAEVAQKMGVAHTLYLSPLSPAYPDALYFPETGTLVIKEALAPALPVKGRRTVAERFFAALPPVHRAEEAVRESILQSACTSLADAAEAHAAIERYYGDGMDFARLSLFADQVAREVLAALG